MDGRYADAGGTRLPRLSGGNRGAGAPAILSVVRLLGRCPPQYPAMYLHHARLRTDNHRVQPDAGTPPPAGTGTGAGPQAGDRGPTGIARIAHPSPLSVQHAELDFGADSRRPRTRRALDGAHGRAPALFTRRPRP